MLLSLSPHPGLPLVREDFFVDDRYVIAMDWIDGTDLEALLAAEGRPGLDPALVIDYLEQAAEALAHLHGHDPPVVHGDVKPANMILTSSGRLVLVDFGLSSTPADELRRAGTAGYVAPEVAAGATTDRGLGRVLARRDGAGAAHRRAALRRRAPSWGAIEPERIPALERIVRTNLATDPARRDSSAAAFVARLRRWWGAELPSGTGHARAGGRRPGEDEADEVARAHGGHCVAPAADGPLLLAFAAAEDGFDAARELAARRGAGGCGHGGRRAAGRERTRGARRRGGAAPRARRPAPGVIDDATAAAIGSGCRRRLGVAELRGAERRGRSSRPGLSIPARAGACPYRGLMAFGLGRR